MTVRPMRLQLSRKKGFRLPPNTVVVARPSKWGNPFVTGRDGTQAECVDLYGKGRGKLVITNINGETTPNKIMTHPVLKELNRGEIVSHVGSLAPAL